MSVPHHASLSPSRATRAMGTPKEAAEYTKIDGGIKVECMTTADAASKKDPSCDCHKMDLSSDEKKGEEAE